MAGNAVKDVIEDITISMQDVIGKQPPAPTDSRLRPPSAPKAPGMPPESESRESPVKNEITDVKHKRLVQHVNDFHDYIPVFERAGFEVKRFEIEVGISPKFIPHFMVHKHISDEDKRRILDEVKGQRILTMILEALFKASYLSEHVKLGTLDFLGMEIHVGAIPTVRLLFGQDVKEH